MNMSESSFHLSICFEDEEKCKCEVKASSFVFPDSAGEPGGTSAV